MIKDKLKSRGHLKYVLKDEDGNIKVERESYNFMCNTLSRVLTEQLGAFMSNTTNDAMKPSYGGFSTIYPSATKLSDGSIKFALAITDNTTVIEESKQSSVFELPGTQVCMTRGVRSVGTQEDVYIESIRVLDDGGIQLKAQIGKGVEGLCGTVGLVMPLDLDFNTDGSDRVYNHALGELLVNKDIESINYISNCVMFNNKIYFATTHSSGFDREFRVWCYDKGYIGNVYTHKDLNSSDAITLQVIGEELWCTLLSDKIYVLSKDLIYLRMEGTKTPIDCVVNNKSENVMFVDGDYVYAVHTLSTSAKTLKVSRGKLKSSGDEAITTKTLNYTDEKNALGIIYGCHKEGTKITTAVGTEVDISTLFDAGTDSVDDAYGVKIEGYPRCLVKGKLLDGVWYGRHFKSHTINTLEGFNMSKNMCNSVYYKDAQSYIVRCVGGSALTCNVLTEADGGAINKTKNDTLTITYTIY